MVMRRAFLVAVVVLAAVPGMARAAGRTDCIAPPGTAALDQYCESIPTAGGDRGSGTHGGGPGAARVPASAITHLSHSGADGRGLVRVLGYQPSSGGHAGSNAAHGSSGGSPAQGVKAERRSGHASAAPAVPKDNPLNAVRESITAGSTVTSSFVWLLLGATVVMAAWAWLVFRRRRTA
jgi:hypothetical protein